MPFKDQVYNIISLISHIIVVFLSIYNLKDDIDKGSSEKWCSLSSKIIVGACYNLKKFCVKIPSRRKVRTAGGCLKESNAPRELHLITETTLRIRVGWPANRSSHDNDKDLGLQHSIITNTVFCVLTFENL